MSFRARYAPEHKTTKENWYEKVFVTLTAILLCVGLLAGCAAPSSTTDSAQPQQTPASAAPQQSPVPDSQEKQPEASQEASNFNATGYPVCNEPVYLTGFGNQNVTHCDWNEAYTFKALSEVTNVYVQWETAPNTGFAEAKSVLLASGDYPDIFFRCSLSSAELTQYGPMGVFADLTEYIDAYAHNLLALMEQYPTIRTSLRQADGAIYGLTTIREPGIQTILELNWVNGVWLERLDLPLPDTTEEFRTLLTTFKTEDANGNGDPNDELPYSDRNSGTTIWTGTYGSFGMGNLGSDLYGVYIDLDQNGVIRCFAVSDEYRTQLEWITQLYSEGLLDPEMFTQDIPTFTAKGDQDLIGVCFGNSSAETMGRYYEDYIGMRTLQGPNGDRDFVRVGPLTASGATFAVNAQSQYIAEAVRWCDYLYSREGCLLMQLGQEGETWTYSEQDGYQLTQAVWDDPQERTKAQVLGSFGAFNAAGGGCPTCIYVDIEKARFSKADTDAAELAMQDLPEGFVGVSLSFSEEEQDTYNTIANDIQTYISEWRVNVVCGQQSIDEWDQYVSTLNQMGLQQYIDIYQAAYDRYLAG